MPNCATTSESLNPLLHSQHLGGLPLLALPRSRLCISLFGSLDSICLATWPSHLRLLNLTISSTVFILALAEMFEVVRRVLPCRYQSEAGIHWQQGLYGQLAQLEVQISIARDQGDHLLVQQLVRQMEAIQQQLSNVQGMGSTGASNPPPPPNVRPYNPGASGASAGTQTYNPGASGPLPLAQTYNAGASGPLPAPSSYAPGMTTAGAGGQVSSCVLGSVPKGHGCA